MSGSPWAGAFILGERLIFGSDLYLGASSRSADVDAGKVLGPLLQQLPNLLFSATDCGKGLEEVAAVSVL